MINLHFAIACIFFVVGFSMRFGLWKNLVMLCYKRIPKLNKNKFDEFDVRTFVGETSIKLGFIILAIAVIGVFDNKDFNLSIILGWFCFVFYAIASVTFIDNVDIFDKRRRMKQKAKFEQAKATFEACNTAKRNESCSESTADSTETSKIKRSNEAGDGPQ